MSAIEFIPMQNELITNNIIKLMSNFYKVYLRVSLVSFWELIYEFVNDEVEIEDVGVSCWIWESWLVESSGFIK